MLSNSERSEIRELLTQGYSVSYVARKTGKSTTTVYRLKDALLEKEESTQKTRSVPQKLQLFVLFLQKRRNQGVRNIQKLYTELQKQGYKGSYAQLYRYIKSLPKKDRDSKPSIRVKTGPGEQAQVDWGYFGKINVNENTERLYAFIYVLGYSRMTYAEFTVRQTLQTLLNCHIHAFEKFGIPRTIVYDNMKTVVQKREKISKNTDKLHFHPQFLDFARHYGFGIYACHPRWPREKGKVESRVKYVRNNFMDGDEIWSRLLFTTRPKRQGCDVA